MKRAPLIGLVGGGLFFASLAFLFWIGNTNGPHRVSYSAFERDLADGKIKSATVTGDDIQAILEDGGIIVTTRVANDLATQFAAHGVEVTGYPPSSGGFGWLLWLPMLMLVPFIFMRGGGIGGAMGPAGAMTQSKAKVFAETEIKVTFDDVAGVDEAKEELKEIVAFLKDPKAYGRLGAHIPKGVLLVGPPGTGKTLLARAVAGEAGVPFLSINGSEFVELYVGVGAARVRDLFAQGREKAPAIIFIDELDALGHVRGGPSRLGGNDEKEQTLNQLLSEMDGFDPSVGLVLLAATNRPEILDPALLRAGRFDRQVLVDRPDKTGRIQILNIYLKKIRLGLGVSAEEIAALTPGFTGADLATLVNEAALLATRRNSEDVVAADFTAAIERIIAGLEKRRDVLEREAKLLLEKETLSAGDLHRLLNGRKAKSLTGVPAVTNSVAA